MTLIVIGGTRTNMLGQTRELDIPSLVLATRSFTSKGTLRVLRRCRVSFVMLTNFLLGMPSTVLRSCPGGVMGVRPTLLPGFNNGNVCNSHIRRTIVTSRRGRDNVAVRCVGRRCSRKGAVFRTAYPMLPASAPSALTAQIRRLRCRCFPQIVRTAVLNGGLSVWCRGARRLYLSSG